MEGVTRLGEVTHACPYNQSHMVTPGYHVNAIKLK